MSQISITLPDGNIRQYAAGITGMDIAKDISTSLAKKAISCSINGNHSDLSQIIETDIDFAIYTMRDDVQALELIRHDCAHIMARAVQEIWPDVQVTIGPVIDNGWYYDFDRKDPFTPEDLSTIISSIISTQIDKLSPAEVSFIKRRVKYSLGFVVN